MNYRNLGKTGLRVSEVGLGCEYFVKASPEEARQMIDYAISQGINLIDVFMPDPDVRSKIGDALQGQRDKMYVQGHVGAVVENGQYKRSRDPEQCQLYIADFLQRLHTDYIDIAMLHYVDEMSDWQTVLEHGILDYMCEQKEKGVFHFLGVSSHNAEVAQEIVRTGKIDVVLFSISPIFDLVMPNVDTFFEMKDEDKFPTTVTIDEERVKFYNLCAERKVGITAMKALAAGCLLDPADSPFGKALTVAQCVQYALDRPAVSSVLVGCKNLEEVKVAAAFAQNSAAEKDYHAVLAAINTGGSKTCMYCNHCLPCPMHINIAEITRLLDSAKNHGMTEALKQAYENLEVKPSECLACGDCVKRCPFGLNVTLNMETAAKLFEECC
ncbi:MAG: aldo/keto reductase [Negativicutes bacterium]|nr:aldo/keto reductase [Negativicutes bacterium]